MGQTPEKQQELYENFWHPMEQNFGQLAYQTEFDSFIRHFLSFKLGEVPRLDHIYSAFKEWYEGQIENGHTVAHIMDELRLFASYYCKMALGQEPDSELKKAFGDLVELKASVAYPMLLEWYDDYQKGLWSREDFAEALRLTESYVWRRAVCGLATNSLNKTFLIFNRNLDKNAYLENVKANYLLVGTYKRFPKDEEFARELKTRNLYINRAKYWIRRLENFAHKEPINLADYTIEHIMPQNKNVPGAWRKELGEEWERVYGQWLHTLGNLTLTGYNPEYSDHPFQKKRDMPGGLAESHLFLNKGLESTQVWNEDAIKARAEILAKRALKVWQLPQLNSEILEKYKPKRPDAPAYSLADHPNLGLPAIKPLFEAIRKEIIALEPNIITEEFLKLYVAYKAETNFVNIYPQTTALRLILNMEF